MHYKMSKIFKVAIILLLLSFCLPPSGYSQTTDKVDRLIQELKDEDWSIRRNAAEALVKIGKPAVESLIAALRDEDWRIRVGAVIALGKIEDLRAVDYLITALRDKSRRVRKYAALALRRLTRKPFGEDPVRWQEWWEENKEAFLKGR